MGGGAFDRHTYYEDKTYRATRGIDDFAYSKTSYKIHDSLNPTRINKKPFKVLESRDSAEHPESNAVLVCFDVTGSNVSRARQAQEALPNLMELLTKYLKYPQIAFAANDDYTVVGDQSIQISEFESDNRIDEHLRNIKLISRGGSNAAESYDLLLYAAARKTSIDCFEKRGKRGYMFMYADEPFFEEINKEEVQDVFGDIIERNIPLSKMIEEVQEKYDLYIVFPEGGYNHAYKQYLTLVDEAHVLVLQHPEKIAETIAITIGMAEEKLDTSSAVSDLVSVGIDKTTASSMVNALVPLARTKSVARVSGGSLQSTGKGAARL